MDRWSLPGPSAFLGTVRALLREGVNIVLGAPSCATSALTVALEDLLAEEWRLAGPFVPTGMRPVDELYSALDIEDHSVSQRSVTSLLAALDSKRVIIVTGIDLPQWPAWQRFLDEYANASRAVTAFDRTQILLITAGVPKARLPAAAPALRQLIWDGFVGEADVFGYVIQARRSSGERIDAQTKLMARIITRLALWDFDLTDRLLEMDPHVLFNPSAAIRSATDGDSTYAKMGTTWEDGGMADFDGEQSMHAVALLRTGDPGRELAMRLWAAQAAELLPALELNRRALAQRMKAARLPLPVEINGERVFDPIDLEIGPLFRLARVHRLPQDVVRIAEKYWSLRNKLAHLSPIEADEALDPEILKVPQRQ
jgi:hypothetical protein